MIWIGITLRQDYQDLSNGENIMKIIIEVDTNEDEEVLELIRRLVALLEKESERERR